MCSCIQVVIYLILNSTNLHRDLLKTVLFIPKLKAERSDCRVFEMSSFLLSSLITFMPAMNHVSFAVLLTCYDFFLLWSSNLDFLFLLPQFSL